MIELVVVVVILGILAAIALPKYGNVNREVDQLVLDQLGVAIEQASSNNRMAYALGHPGAVALTACSHAGFESLLHTRLPQGMGVGLAPGSGACETAGLRCRLTHRAKGNINTSFNVSCAGN